MPRVFFVTGSSAGLGEALVKEILDNGDYVIATARKPEVLIFDKATSTNFLAVQLDLLDSNSVLTAYLTGVAKFGRIDVVVNNGGYGLSGPFEDLTDEDIQRQMDVNFTGAVVSTRAAIKVMREQSPPGGIIQQITSIGGRIGMPYMCMYSASKFALEGFTEAVSQEMDPKWGIKFTCVEPGGFRTDFFARSMVYTNSTSSVYDLAAVSAQIKEIEKSQRGDPPKGAKALYHLATSENPPKKTVLGSDAYEWLNQHMTAEHEDLLRNESLARSTDIDD
ncbi:uncharacterized protein N7500_005740 [Penicillium coprophilum]|uniref:uncharacterized protein n=1 Tax=Penicillium coprophilum TaxID=36646 RepID=UPI0023A3C98D|nr:uncharacterized protein N7500_005740 [Penicillium coprophilum]KAJ5163910.1 hypothetical protein N7500_005740 [Penicillium coprophilum]